ncbi:TetR/AcrR family transcriptional regulator [Methanosarcina mazei]|jgi:AcrR family transcriptional regulator|uniref:TetR family transcriptional regulator n=3 Tax=Methanosarcina mazei TaxID=2209 RepID=A0A0F8NX36_METMZ|nr:TetR/AcrR family transcriptional regulator [Methanosarcina mazei]AKB41966.1 Transcriptional regulator, TetR family [Methanosarcina mazei WWM610]AKB62903.1 Transcriptional regulator, TetR family [Methanosarcina mazei SarPi]KKG70082.1 TetR family transcriptional regulator [Methanosarcina mazei]KKH16746.1 TetR family transcriptional regulator [Methanosarcina mazei]KKH23666.1 TetR family transcriptional regulator [Methanosarcina mazei]
MKEQIKDKRTAILKAALKLFTERGFHGTSTAQISKNAGVATGTLFNYFPTKEDLINSLYFEVKGNLSHAMGNGLEAESTFQDKLKKIWSNLVNWGVENQEEFLFVGQFCSSPYITKFTRDEVMKEYIFLHNLVDEGIKAGKIRDFSAELVIAMFYQSSRTVVNFILDSDSSLDENKVSEDGFQILWRGLVKE